MKDKAHTHTEECSECGETVKNFVHICPESSNVLEIHGCTNCDDSCPFCGPDIGGEG